MLQINTFSFEENIQHTQTSSAASWWLGVVFFLGSDPMSSQENVQVGKTNPCHAGITAAYSPHLLWKSVF